MKKNILIFLVNILIALTIGGILLILIKNPHGLGNLNPFMVYFQSFGTVLSRPKHLANIIIRATPIIMTGLSVSFAFKAGLFNIGVEGQFIIGSLAAVFAGYFIKFLPIVIHPIFVMLIAGFFGGLWAMLVGYLKVKFKIHEVLSSIMLNWIALYLNNFIVKLQFIKRPESESTYDVLETARLGILSTWKNSDEGIAWRVAHRGNFFSDILSTNLNFSIFVAILFVVVYSIILNKTTLGYKIKAVGFNKTAANYGGINIQKTFLISMFISGAFAGIAGASNVLSVNFHSSVLNAMEGNGFNGIAVAFMGFNHPVGILFAGLFFGFLAQSGTVMQNIFTIPSEIISIIIGFTLLFIAIRPKEKSKN